MELELGRRVEHDHSLVTKFASGQETYYHAKFGVYFKSSRLPINTITIDENKIVHGFLVSNTMQANQTGLRTFAAKMKGIMKVHLVHVKTMKHPIIIDLN